MRNRDQWQPTKFVLTQQGLRASRNPAQVAPGSRFVADITAHEYAERIERHAHGDLIDLGCGHAPLYATYAPRVDSVLLVDWGGTLHRNPFLDLEWDLNKPLPLASESADTVLTTDVLEHIAHPDGFMAEVARLLRPGGVLILGVPFLYRVHEEPYDFHRYTEYRLRMYCEELGLDVLELVPYGGSFEVLADFTAKHVAFSEPLSRAHLAIAEWLARWTPMERLRRSTEHKFPLGYILVAAKREAADTLEPEAKAEA